MTDNFATRLKSTAAAICLTALCAAGAAPALADDQDSGSRSYWGMGHMMDGWGMRGGPMMGYGPGNMLDRIDGRLAFLKTELKITEAQSEAWKELSETVSTTAEAHNDMMRSMMDEMHDGDFADMPLPERLQYQETHMQARLEQIKAVREAVEKLYAVLDDNQKKTADEIVLPAMGMGMGMGMGTGRGRGMGPGMMYR